MDETNSRMKIRFKKKGNKEGRKDKKWKKRRKGWKQ